MGRNVWDHGSASTHRHKDWWPNISHIAILGLDQLFGVLVEPIGRTDVQGGGYIGDLAVCRGGEGVEWVVGVDAEGRLGVRVGV